MTCNERCIWMCRVRTTHANKNNHVPINYTAGKGDRIATAACPFLEVTKQHTSSPVYTYTSLPK